MGQITTIQHHDTGILPAGQVTSFRAWLKGRGINTRNSKPSDDQSKRIHFWVCMPCEAGQRETWVTVREDSNDKNNHALTHVRLRSMLNDFLADPVSLAVRQAIQQKVDDARKAPAATVTNRQPALLKTTIVVTPKVVATQPAAPVMPAAPEKAITFKPSGCGGACKNDRTAKAAPKLTQYLEDLRDDFALNCPFSMLPGESLPAFANRRWMYAQAMVEARLP